MQPPELGYGTLVRFDDIGRPGEWAMLDLDIPAKLQPELKKLIGLSDDLAPAYPLLANHIIIQWYVSRRGEPLPITEEAMAETPLAVVTRIAQAFGQVFAGLGKPSESPSTNG